jgi:hypothetical protein
VGKKQKQPVVLDVRSGCTLTDEEVFQAAIDYANGVELVLFRNERRSQPTYEDREEVVRLLTLIADGDRGAVADECLPMLTRLFSGLRVRVTCSIVIGQGFVLGQSRDFLNARALLDYAVALTLDAKLPYGAALARCRLPSCGLFYVAKKNPKGGPLNKTYCTPEHRADHHNSAERKAGAKLHARYK